MGWRRTRGGHAPDTAYRGADSHCGQLFFLRGNPNSKLFGENHFALGSAAAVAVPGLAPAAAAAAPCCSCSHRSNRKPLCPDSSIIYIYIDFWDLDLKEPWETKQCRREASLRLIIVDATNKLNQVIHVCCILWGPGPGGCVAETTPTGTSHH